MLDKIRMATQYATKTHRACALQDEEHLEILKELLSMEGVQLNGDERDNSVELEKFNFKLNN